MGNLETISRARDLPDWYDLRNYADAASLSIEGWYINIIKRHEYCSFFNQWHDPDPVRNFLEAGQFVIMGNSGSLLKIDESFTAVKVIEEPQELTKFATPDSSQIMLTINLDYEDWIIKSSLESILEEKRSEFGQPKRKTRKRPYEVEKWHEIGLLPYIDLRLWERLNNSQITWSAMTNAINPPGEGDFDRTRQTIDRLAEKLVFTGEDLGKFRIQVNRECPPGWDDNLE